LPSIRDPKFNVVYKPYTPNIPGLTQSQIFFRNPPNEKFAYNYLTGWGITMKYRTSHFPNGSQYCNSYVQFLKPIRNGPNVIDYDSNGYVLEKFMLEDKTKFFWGNATTISNMIEESMNTFRQYSGLSSDDYRFVKNGAYWSILTRVGLDIEAIYFNDEMRRLFDFPYDENNGIQIKYGSITTLNNIDYYVTTTEKTNSYLFPFRNIGMSRLVMTLRTLHGI
jgi:hypothetical protein